MQLTSSHTISHRACLKTRLESRLQAVRRGNRPKAELRTLPHGQAGIFQTRPQEQGGCLACRRGVLGSSPAPRTTRPHAFAGKTPALLGQTLWRAQFRWFTAACRWGATRVISQQHTTIERNRQMKIKDVPQVGKLGLTVTYPGRYGLVRRSLVTPRNPQTGAQQVIRQDLAHPPLTLEHLYSRQITSWEQVPLWDQALITQA